MPRPLRILSAFSAAIIFTCTLSGVARLSAADPLRFMPQQAGFILKVEQPRQFVEAIATLDVYQNAQQFPQVREYLDSTPVRRFFQLVAFLETQTGSPWPELIDKLAGGGIALGIAIADDPAPALLVVQGTDEAAVETTYKLLLAAITDEASRDGSNQPLRKAKFGDIDTIHAGDEFHAARVGSVVFISNTDEALRAGLALAAKKEGQSALDRPTVAAARTLVGGDPVAWAWFDLAKVKESQEAKDFLESTRSDIFQTVIFGSTVDAVRRSDFLCAGLFQTRSGFHFTLRMPAKRADLDDAMALHVPKEDRPGSLPLLQPKGVVYSQSFYLDLAHLWTNRKTLINDEVREQLEKADTDISKVLPGTTFGTLLEQSGPYHRVVMAHTGEKLYSREPGQLIPPFAVVTSMRDEAFGQSMDGVLRGGAFLAGFQTGWKMAEEKFDGVTVVSYRFPEKGEPKFDDPEGLRFAFAPAFAVVGKSLVVGSTPGIVKALIPELKKEAQDEGARAVWRAKAYLPGAAEVLLAYPEQAITQMVLTQGIGLAEAKQQVQDLAAWLRTLGTYELRIDHADAMYTIDIEWKYGK
jgi:hypothetical protein